MKNESWSPPNPVTLMSDVITDDLAMSPMLQLNKATEPANPNQRAFRIQHAASPVKARTTLRESLLHANLGASLPLRPTNALRTPHNGGGIPLGTITVWKFENSHAKKLT